MPHNFGVISAQPDRTISLELQGNAPSLFLKYFDTYPIEASTNLVDWTPLTTLVRTNLATNDLFCRASGRAASRILGRRRLPSGRSGGRDATGRSGRREERVRLEDAQSVCGWSTWPQSLLAPRKRWPWLRVDRLLGEYRIGGDRAAGRRGLEEEMERGRSGENGTEFQAVRREWCAGSTEFRRELLEQMVRAMGPHHDGQERWETAEAVAARIVAKQLARLGWSDDDLANRS